MSHHARNEGEDSEVKLQSCQTDLLPKKTPGVCVLRTLESITRSLNQKGRKLAMPRGAPDSLLISISCCTVSNALGVHVFLTCSRLHPTLYLSLFSLAFARGSPGSSASNRQVNYQRSYKYSLTSCLTWEQELQILVLLVLAARNVNPGKGV